MSTEYVCRQFLPEMKAAEYLGVSQPTLNRWKHSGKGPAHYDFPGRVMYTVEDLDAWLATRRREANTVAGDVAA